jgi:Amt family ammonium transporter
MSQSLALVAISFFIVPALVFFFSTIRPQELASRTYTLTFTAIIVIVFFWIILGWSLAFGDIDIFGLFSDPTSSFLLNFNYNAPNVNFASIEGAAASVNLARVGYELIFPLFGSIIIGGIIEKQVRIAAWCGFILLWVTLYYAPIAHIIWNEGLLGYNGLVYNLLGTYTIDFAGGLPLFVGSSVSALVLSLIINDSKIRIRKSRKKTAFGYLKDEEVEVFSVPSIVTTTTNMPSQSNQIETTALIDAEAVSGIVRNKQRQLLSLFGLMLVLFGWLMFILAGVKDPDSNSAGIVWINGLVVVSSCVLTWFLIEKILISTISQTGFILSTLGGLAAASAIADCISPGIAIIVGFFSAVICFFGSVLFNKVFNQVTYIDYISVIFFGGISGSLSVGLFSSYGLISGLPMQIVVQLVGIVFTIVFSLIISFVVGLIIDKLVGFRNE